MATDALHKRNSILEYTMRVGKSIGYASFDAIKNQMPFTTQLVENNRETVKQLYTDITSSRQQLNKFSNLQDNYIFKPSKELLKNLKEDLKSGNFYNKKRQESAQQAAEDDMMKQLLEGEGLGDLSELLSGEEDLSEEDLEDFTIKPQQTISTGEAMIASITAREARMATNSLLKAQTSLAEAQMKTARGIANMQLKQTQRNTNIMQQGFGQITSGFNALFDFNNTVVLQHAKNAQKYFSTMSQLTQENNAILKELIEMQRNLYKDYNAKMSEKKSPTAFKDGIFDLKSYMDLVKSNMNMNDSNSFLPMLGSMVKGQIGQFTANPLGMILSTIASSMMGPSLRTSMRKFDSNLRSAIQTSLVRLGRAGTDKNSGFITKLLGSIFGINDKQVSVKSIDTTKMLHGPHPFDAEDHFYLTHVFPSYLARIEAALTNSPERVFDSRVGKFVTAKSVKEILKKNESKMAKSELEDVLNEIRNTMFRTLKVDPNDRKTLNQINKDLMDFAKGVHSSGGFGSNNFADIKSNKNNRYGNAAQFIYEMLVNGYIDRSVLQNAESRILSNRVESRNNRLSGANLSFEEIFAAINGDRTFNESSKAYKNARSMKSVSQKAQYNLLEWQARIHETLTEIRDKIPEIDDLSYISTGRSNKQRRIRPVGMKGKKKTNKQATEFNKDPNNGVYENNGWLFYSDGKQLRDPNGIFYDRNGDPIKDSAFQAAFEAAAGSKIGTSSNLNYKDLTNPTISEIYKQHLQNVSRKNTEYQSRKELYSNKEILDAAFSTKDNGLDYINANLGRLHVNPNDDIIKQMAQAATIGDKMGVIANNINKIITSPRTILTSVITQADKLMYDMLFTRNTKRVDKDGKPIYGLFNHMVDAADRVSYDMGKASERWINDLNEGKVSPLDAVSNFLDKQFDLNTKQTIDRYKDRFKAIGNDIKDTAKTSGKNIFDEVKNAVTGTWSDIRGAFASRAYGSSFPGESQGSLSFVSKGEAIIPGYMNPYSSSYGKGGYYNRGTTNVERGGLTTLGKGDLVIPSTKNPWNPNRATASIGRDAANEAYMKRNLINQIQNAPSYAGGNAIDEAEIAASKESDDYWNPEEEELAKASDGLASSIKEFGTRAFGSDIAAGIRKTKDLILDNKVSTMTGAMKGAIAGTIFPLGGPLLGALAGASMSLLSKNEKFTNYIFGTKIGDKRADDGMIPVDFMKSLETYIPDMKKYGITGTLLGLVTPFGPLGGLMAGLAASYIKNNEKLSNFIFGNDRDSSSGLFSRDRRAAIKKALPNIGVGMLSTFFLGPFGLLGNAALGAGMGLLTTTESFKKIMLGAKGRNGERHGGIAGAIRRHIVNPLKESMDEIKKGVKTWFRDDILKPIGNGLQPIGEEAIDQVKDSIKSLFGALRGSGRGMGGRAEQFIDALFNSPSKAIGGFVKGVAKDYVGQGASWLSHKIENVGNKVQRKRLNEGRLHHLAARERIAEAERLRKAGVLDNYQLSQFDKNLADMNDSAISSNLDLLKSYQYLYGGEGRRDVELEGQQKLDYLMSDIGAATENNRHLSSIHGKLIGLAKEISGIEKPTDLAAIMDDGGKLDKLLFDEKYGLNETERNQIRKIFNNSINEFTKYILMKDIYSRPEMHKEELAKIKAARKELAGDDISDEEFQKRLPQLIKLLESEGRNRNRASREIEQEETSAGRVYNSDLMNPKAQDEQASEAIKESSEKTADNSSEIVKLLTGEDSSLYTYLASLASNGANMTEVQKRLVNAYSQVQFFKNRFAEHQQEKEQLRTASLDDKKNYLNTNKIFNKSQNADWETLFNDDRYTDTMKDLYALSEAYKEGNTTTIDNITEILRIDPKNTNLFRRVSNLALSGFFVEEKDYKDLFNLSDLAFDVLLKLIQMGGKIKDFKSLAGIGNGDKELHDNILKLAAVQLSKEVEINDLGDKENVDVKLINDLLIDSIADLAKSKSMNITLAQDDYQNRLNQELNATNGLYSKYTKNNYNDPSVKGSTNADNGQMMNYAWNKNNYFDATRLHNREHGIDAVVSKTGRAVGGAISGFGSMLGSMAHGAARLGARGLDYAFETNTVSSALSNLEDKSIIGGALLKDLRALSNTPNAVGLREYLAIGSNIRKISNDLINNSYKLPMYRQLIADVKEGKRAPESLPDCITALIDGTPMEEIDTISKIHNAQSNAGGNFLKSAGDMFSKARSFFGGNDDEDKEDKETDDSTSKSALSSFASALSGNFASRPSTAVAAATSGTMNVPSSDGSVVVMTPYGPMRYTRSSADGQLMEANDKNNQETKDKERAAIELQERTTEALEKIADNFGGGSKDKKKKKGGGLLASLMAFLTPLSSVFTSLTTKLASIGKWFGKGIVKWGGKLLRGLGGLLGKIPGVGAAVGLAKTGLESAKGAIGLGKAGKEAAEVATEAKAASDVAKGAKAARAAKAGTDAAKAVGGAADTGILDGFRKTFTNFWDKLTDIVGSKLSGGKKFLKMLKNRFLRVLLKPKFARPLVRLLLKFAPRLATGAATLGLGMLAWDIPFMSIGFYDGYKRSEELLGVEKGSTTVAMDVICGIAGAMAENTIIGILGTVLGMNSNKEPAKAILDYILEAPFIGLIIDKDNLEKLRSNNRVRPTNADEDDDIDVNEEELDENKLQKDIDQENKRRQQKFNNDYKENDEYKDYPDGKFDAVESASGSSFFAPSSGTGKYGRRKAIRSRKLGRASMFESQLDSKNAMRMQIPGDTEYMDMANRGCGEIATVNALRSQGNMTVTGKDAGKFALSDGNGRGRWIRGRSRFGRNRYLDPNDGTKPQFIHDYAQSNGMNTKNIHNQEEFDNYLNSGGSIVVAGKDYDRNTTPITGGETLFTENPHYSTVTGRYKDHHGRAHLMISDPQGSTPEPQDYLEDDIFGKIDTAVGVKGFGKFGRRRRFGRASMADMHKADDASGQNATTNTQPQQNQSNTGNGFTGYSTFDNALQTALSNSPIGQFLVSNSPFFASIMNRGRRGGSSGGAGASGSWESTSSSGGIQEASKWAESMVGTTGYGNNGCTEFVKRYLLKANNPIGHYMEDATPIASEVAAAAAKVPEMLDDTGAETLMWVPTLEVWAKMKGYWKDVSQGGAEGDICVCNDHGHVIIADGKGGAWGNSSGQNKILHYDSISESYSDVNGYIATGAGTSVVSRGSFSRTREEELADGGSSNSDWGSGKFGKAKKPDTTRDTSAGNAKKGAIKKPPSGRKSFSNLIKRRRAKGKYGRDKSTEQDGPRIWQYLTQNKGLSNIATAGIMGNLKAESALYSDRVQNAAPDEGTDVVPVDGETGYGLAQWTYETRQRGLADFLSSKGLPGSDWKGQLDFMLSGQDGDLSAAIHEMDESKDPYKAGLIFHNHYEGSDDDAEQVQRRGSYAKDFFENEGNGQLNGPSNLSNSGGSGGSGGGSNRSSLHGVKGFSGIAVLDDALTYALNNTEMGKFLVANSPFFASLANRKGGANRNGNKPSSNSPKTTRNSNEKAKITDPDFYAIDFPTTGTAANFLVSTLKGSKIISKYGQRGQGFHAGIDISADTGTEIPMPVAGTVEETGTRDTDGRYIIIRDEKNNFHIFTHLETPLCETESSVKQGQIIAYSGDTGTYDSEGPQDPHIHYAIYANPECKGKNGSINPEMYSITDLGTDEAMVDDGARKAAARRTQAQEDKENQESYQRAIDSVDNNLQDLKSEDAIRARAASRGMKTDDNHGVIHGAFGKGKFGRRKFNFGTANKIKNVINRLNQPSPIPSTLNKFRKSEEKNIISSAINNIDSMTYDQIVDIVSNMDMSQIKNPSNIPDIHNDSLSVLKAKLKMIYKNDIPSARGKGIFGRSKRYGFGMYGYNPETHERMMSRRYNQIVNNINRAKEINEASNYGSDIAAIVENDDVLVNKQTPNYNIPDYENDSLQVIRAKEKALGISRQQELTSGERQLLTQIQGDQRDRTRAKNSPSASTAAPLTDSKLDKLISEQTRTNEILSNILQAIVDGNSANADSDNENVYSTARNARLAYGGVRSEYGMGPDYMRSQMNRGKSYDPILRSLSAVTSM